MEKTNLYKKLLIGKKKHLQYQNKLIKSKVNINVLLNRVKIEEKNENKKK